MTGNNLCAGGCGRRVAANKYRCRACIEEAAHATVNARNEEPMDTATHILMVIDSQDQEDLYRASDGMLVASRHGDTVRFGLEPKEASNRMFLSKDHAAAWIRKLASMELYTRKGDFTLADAREIEGGAQALIEERNAEKLITLPGGSFVQKMARN